jgi:hypothetical protein
MADPRSEFIQSVQHVLARHAQQNGRTPWSEADTAAIGERLWALMAERGLPPPLAPQEMGEPGEMPPEEVAPLIARVLDGIGGAEALATPLRQLVKACFQPDFRKCRESYHEVEADGTCRRQQLKKARDRVSGTHCVDCPYWLTLTPEQHEKFLAQAWVGDAAELAAHRDVFLPEDFRALRRCVREQAAATR